MGAHKHTCLHLCVIVYVIMFVSLPVCVLCYVCFMCFHIHLHISYKYVNDVAIIVFFPVSLTSLSSTIFLPPSVRNCLTSCETKPKNR